MLPYHCKTKTFGLFTWLGDRALRRADLARLPFIRDNTLAELVCMGIFCIHLHDLVERVDFLSCALLQQGFIRGQPVDFIEPRVSLT